MNKSQIEEEMSKENIKRALISLSVEDDTIETQSKRRKVKKEEYEDDF